MKYATVFLLLFVLSIFTSCCGDCPDLPDGVIRDLATKYRDDWLKQHGTIDDAPLWKSTIDSVEKTENGWHVVFVFKPRMNPNEPEGMHHYFLHVYVKRNGELEKVVRGPDLLSRKDDRPFDRGT